MTQSIRYRQLEGERPSWQGIAPATCLFRTFDEELFSLKSSEPPSANIMQKNNCSGDHKHSERGWRVDFSLALFNRTGKYFIGKSLLDENEDLIDRISYWRVFSKDTPCGLKARILGKLEAIERDLRVQRKEDRWRAKAGTKRWLHLDPLTVLHRELREQDVVLCHDLGPVTHPQLFGQGTGDVYAMAFDYIRQVQPHIVFVSHASSTIYRDIYGSPRKSSVICPPIRADLGKSMLVGPENVTGPFLLTVGSIGTRKNQASAIRAFAGSGLRARGYSYVLCGEIEPGGDEVKELAKKTDGVVVLPYVSDSNIRWLYANAQAFVLPSLLEGFGMPVAESIAAGLIPVVSQGGVLEEVAGEGCLTIDCMSVEDISRGMLEAVDMDADEKSSRIRRMQEHVQAYSEDTFHRHWRSVLTGRD
ncbi:glycosyltransferase [Novosphingobium album (ex Hu et al. 2023)]|uniref:Glycosyltransferase n=1 Tax=Novosphingobium album (ex Hu et al. 2023) TaxID=2930093 RepID=A0ABT0B405_9SPHN|nr:glycosyltransferase [Novosphingobium album (ex Hu et al. 2023)]MCJ2179792.1 glycosyltransferase [Novosphingobium album (ex Hu et al. 2023)]